MMTSASSRLIVTIFVIIAGVTIQVNGELEWWQKTTIYEIWPASFKDSDGDGFGDLKGITSKLDYLNDLGIETIWIAPCFPSPKVDTGYDVSDYKDIDPIYGTLDDMDELIACANELGMKVLLDYVPNHSSTDHDWFQLSTEGVEPYTDYYVWHEGILHANGTRQPPNNWLSRFNSGSAWQWNENRQAYYLHQFTEEQADLNYRNDAVIQESLDVMTFWLDRGIAGFRIDAVIFMYEDTEWRDEPVSGDPGYAPTDYFYLNHIYTTNLIENYEMIKKWRTHLDDYSEKHADGVQRVMFTEAYANISMTSLYYDYGAHFPFNFFLIGGKSTSYSATTQTATGLKTIIDNWMDNMPENGVANWVMGNHDRGRVASRYGNEKVDTFNFMLLLLPGVATIYNGEEIGMVNTPLTWEETEDPQACSTDPTRYASYSRDPERSPFQWDDTTSAGFSTNTTVYLKVNDNYRTLNMKAQSEADKSYLKNFKIAVKVKGTPVAHQGGLVTRVIDDVVLAFSRELDGYDPLLVVFNWSNTSVTVSLDEFSNFNDNLHVVLTDVNNDLEVGDVVCRSNVELTPHAAVVFTSPDTPYDDCSDTSQVSCLIPYIKSYFNV